MSHDLNRGRRMPASIHWSYPNRHNIRQKRYLVLHPWRGVLAGETVALPDADAWRLLAVGAVLEVAREDQGHGEVESIVHPTTGESLRVAWIDSVNPLDGTPMRVGVVQQSAE